MDYYKVLGVAGTASPEEIKKAFRTLAHQHHPDKKGGNDAKFKELNEAYQVLGNPEKRQQYDQFGATGDPRQGGFNWQGAQSGGGFNGNVDFGDLGDIFGDMFGFGRNQGRPAQGNDVQIEIELTFEESFFGGEKKI